jgi:hypothetical protein
MCNPFGPKSWTFLDCNLDPNPQNGLDAGPVVTCDYTYQAQTCVGGSNG